METAQTYSAAEPSKLDIVFAKQCLWKVYWII